MTAKTREKGANERGYSRWSSLYCNTSFIKDDTGLPHALIIHHVCVCVCVFKADAVNEEDPERDRATQV